VKLEKVFSYKTQGCSESTRTLHAQLQTAYGWSVLWWCTSAHVTIGRIRWDT